VRILSPMASAIDESKAATHVIDYTDTVGMLTLAVPTTAYSITLPDGFFQCILDATAGVAVCNYVDAPPVLVSAAEPVAGFVVGAGVAPVIAGGAVVQATMPVGTGTLYFQRVKG
jgi:hypothetical protein